MSFPIMDLEICPGNCSYRGDCLSGTCLCEVQFTGCSCDRRNLVYFITFGFFFYVVCLTAVVQLILCIRADFYKMKRPNILLACRLNVQKSVYVTVIFASGSRAAYFICQLIDLVSASLKENLFSTFYPFVMSAFALIICFWAESFHLSDVQTVGYKQFLTKSYSGYVAFNVVVYIMWVAQIALSHLLPSYHSTELNLVFNGGFAFLMFTVLVFFLIYGVEIFCKVEGAFKPDSQLANNAINFQQLVRSRVGLVAQAAFQLAVSIFLMSKVLGKLWKRKMSTGERNMIDISFHVAELACALWFPCCLWNVTQPGELWILNPKKLLMMARQQEGESLVHNETEDQRCYNTFEDDEKDQVPLDGLSTEIGECWICYDTQREGDIIQPCDCKGGMRVVHHDCLKTWLLERASGSKGSNSDICCSVCKAKYNVTNDHSLVCQPNLKQFRAWTQTFFTVAAMISLPVVIFFIWDKISQAIIKTTVLVLLLLVEYIFLRLLGFNFLTAYNITKTRALKILGKTTKPRSVGDVNSETSESDLAVIVRT